MSTPPDQEFDLHLPAGTGAAFDKDIAEIPVEKRRYWRFHEVQDGDTLASLARTWHVSQSELAFVNQLKPDADLDGVDSVIIPQAPSDSGVLRTTLYKPRKGDTLVTIADRFGVTVAQLRRWNRIYSGNAIAPGRKLYVSEPARLSGLHYGRKRKGSTKTAGKAAPKTARSSKKKAPARAAH
jgi:membrane-bound lytic murein transglycosylase D